MRIQILRLPDEFVGDQVKDRFALVIDQWPEGDSTRWDAALKGFATDCGAAAILAVPFTVEVVDEFADKPAPVEG